MYLSVFGTERISSDEGSKDISDKFYLHYFVKNVNGRKTGPGQLSLFSDARKVLMGNSQSNVFYTYLASGVFLPDYNRLLYISSDQRLDCISVTE